MFEIYFLNIFCVRKIHINLCACVQIGLRAGIYWNLSPDRCHHDDNPAFTICAILLFDDPWFLPWLQLCYRVTTFRISSINQWWWIWEYAYIYIYICHVSFLWLRISCVDEFHKDVVFIYEPDIFIHCENLIFFRFFILPVHIYVHVSWNLAIWL